MTSYAFCTARSMATMLGCLSGILASALIIIQAIMNHVTIQDVPFDPMHVLNVGDSMGRMRWRKLRCVLPSKKYLYQTARGPALNRSPGLSLALQRLGPNEVKAAGLSALCAKQAQDLAGNAFTSTVCVSVLLAMLISLSSLSAPA